MNILFFYPSAIDERKGGVQKVTYDTAKHLISLGHNVVFLSQKKDENKELENQFYLPESRRLLSIINFKYYLRICSDLKIDIVINQGALGGNNFSFCCAVKFLKKIRHIKVFSVIHSSPLGGIQRFRLQNRLVRYLLRLLYIGKYSAKYIFTYLFSDKVVLLSGSFIEELRCFIPFLKEKKIKIIPNMVNCGENNFDYQRANEILFVGRLDNSCKNLTSLLNIWKRVQPRNLNWKLVIVGEGNDRSLLESKVVEENINNVNFEGHQNPEQYYKRGSLFCLTSYREGFGLVLVEAQSYGMIPILFNSFATAKDIITDQKNGFLIEPFSEELYAKQLELLMSEQVELDGIRQNAYLNSKRYSANNIGRKWVEMFSEE